MKTILDASFRYTPSFETDVRKTFDRLRRERQAQARRDAPGARAGSASPLACAPGGADDLLAHVGDLAGARGAGAVAVTGAGTVGAARADDSRGAG
jgi:hypothetical protein